MNALTQTQINQLVEEYKAHYEGNLEDVTEDKVLTDLASYIVNFTDYVDFQDVPFDELLSFIG